MIKRVKTEIPGFDKLVSGGFPDGALILVSGTPGTGKSIFCAQTLYNNALKGKKCLYMNLEQDEHRLERQMELFGWTPKKLEKNFKIVEVNSADPNLVEYILDEIEKIDYDIIVLDSLDSISSSPLSAKEAGRLTIDEVAEDAISRMFDATAVGRLKLKRIFGGLSKSKATAFFTSEKVKNTPGISRDTVSEFLCDGIVVLIAERLGEEFSRAIAVEKMRHTKIDGSLHSLEITSKGLTVQ